MLAKNICLISAIAVLSACQTTGSAKTSDDILFKGLTTEKQSETLAVTRKAEDPVCVRYYANATQYAASSKRKGLASGFIKTLAMGTLAGAASGGVGSLGISSGFIELALAGAANQVVFQGGNAALDTLTGKDESEPSPIEEIEVGAKSLGCPKPQKASAKAAKKLMKEKEKASKSEK